MVVKIIGADQRCIVITGRWAVFSACFMPPQGHGRGQGKVCFTLSPLPYLITLLDSLYVFKILEEF